jgi:hypothetical protein
MQTGTEDRVAQPASICGIRSDRDRYVGSTVLIEVTYVTDSSHYAYVEDGRCSDRSRMSLKYVQHVPSSVRDFFQARRQRCDALGKGMCVAEAKLKAIAKVVKDSEGTLMLDLLEVHEFSFSKP